MPAKNKPRQKKPLQKNNQPQDEQETHHDTNTSQKTDNMKLDRSTTTAVVYLQLEKIAQHLQQPITLFL
jgi:hypothetical protein